MYWHFTNKLAVFRAMREQVSLPLFDRTDRLDADAADPLAAVEQFLHGIVARIAADLQTRRTFDILSLKCEYVDEFRPELKRHTVRCAELTAKFAAAYGRARKLGMLRADVAVDTAALATSVFVTGLMRLWLMDSDATLVRSRADALIASHIALLRAQPPRRAA